MGVVGVVLIGLLVGLAAKLLMPGKDPGGFIVTILLGVAGSFLGAFIGAYLNVGDGLLTNFGMAVIGSMLLLALFRAITRATTTS